jgi:hypothetical protein
MHCHLQSQGGLDSIRGDRSTFVVIVPVEALVPVILGDVAGARYSRRAIPEEEDGG